MSTTQAASKKRINFGKVKHLAQMPDLLGIQIQSFKDFFQLETTPDKRNNEGLFKVFKENFPITDTRNIFVLEFLDYFIRPATPLKSVWSVVSLMPFRLKPNCA
jgi:DNA-directed RNA polymerase subunit beta